MKEQTCDKRELMARITVKVWTDPEFKKRLIEYSRATLEAEGLEIPKDFDGEIIVFEDSSKKKHFVIPAPPEVLTINEKDLKTLAAQRLAEQLELF